MRKHKAFSVVELLIALIILGILGGGAVVALYYIVTTYAQIDDYTAADYEIEFAVQRLTREFALVGLGMPNNRGGEGSFAVSFRENNQNNWPIMAYFGAPRNAWGGPVTVAGSYDPNATPRIGSVPLETTTNNFVGPELFYAWSVPTGIKVMITHAAPEPGTVETDIQEARNEDPLTIGLLQAEHRNVLTNFRWDERDIGLQTVFDNSTSGLNMRTWLTFPTLRLPLRADRWDSSNALSLDVTAAPVPMETLEPLGVGDETIEFRRTVMELDEIHLMQAARLYLDNGTQELRRVIFNTNYMADDGNYPYDVLARHVVGLQFAYNPYDRLLSMFIAVRGVDVPLGNSGILFNDGDHLTYPAWMPESAKISQNMHFRIIGKTFTWRIRN